MMRRIIRLSALLICVIHPQAHASTEQVDALIETVREETLREAAHDAERIDLFLKQRESQRQMLKDARASLAAENLRADKLREQYEGNEKRSPNTRSS